MYVPDGESEEVEEDCCSRFRRRTRRIEERGVFCGEMGGNRDWKTEVVRFSRCLGMLAPGVAAAAVLKLFMTSYADVRESLYRQFSMKQTRGGVRCSMPPPLLLGCRCALATSLHKEYFSTLKFKVGPRGEIAIRKLVFPAEDREKSIRCVTPSGPAIVV